MVFKRPILVIKIMLIVNNPRYNVQDPILYLPMLLRVFLHLKFLICLWKRFNQHSLHLRMLFLLNTKTLPCQLNTKLRKKVNLLTFSQLHLKDKRNNLTHQGLISKKFFHFDTLIVFKLLHLKIINENYNN